MDVDGTIDIRGRCNTALVQKLWGLKSKGYELTLWSARGRQYAEKVAQKHGIQELFAIINGKPEIIMDNAGLKWLRNVKVVKKLATTIAD